MDISRRAWRALALVSALLALAVGPLSVQADSASLTKTYTRNSGQWIQVTTRLYFSWKACPGMQDAVKFTSYTIAFQEPQTNHSGITQFADNAGSQGPICGGGSSLKTIHFWADERVAYTWNASLSRYVSPTYQSGLTGFPWVVSSDISATALHVGIKETYQPPPGSPIPVIRYCHKQILQGFSEGGCSRNPA